MNLISTRAHALLDYLFGVFLFLSPWAFGFEENNLPKAIAIGMGIGITLFSLFTKYEGGLLPVIPLGVHLFFDVVSGLFLVTAPWLTGFGDAISAPFVVFGSIQLVVVLLTNTKTGTPRDPDRAIP
jgi:hypothetical protein